MKTIDTKTAAQILGVTPRRITAMIEQGRLQAIKDGKSWSITESALDTVKDRKPGRPRKTNEGG